MPYPTGHVRHPAKDHLIEAAPHKLLLALAHAPALAAPPAQFSCITQGWVGPIKDQSQCGSCWDFSGTAVVEGALYKAGVLKPDGSDALSEEYTLDCGQNGGCNGDDNVTVLAWAKATGLPRSADYGPYNAMPGQCAYRPGMHLYQIADWGFVQGQGVASDALIKVAMMAYGPIGCAIAADSAFENTPSGKVFLGTGNTGLNHDVTLVGWDDTKGRQGKTAWLLRNSWGMSWSMGGYCWILSGANLVGTEAVYAQAAAAPVPPPVPPTPPIPPVPPPGTVTFSFAWDGHTASPVAAK